MDLFLLESILIVRLQRVLQFTYSISGEQIKIVSDVSRFLNLTPSSGSPDMIYIPNMQANDFWTQSTSQINTVLKL